VFTLDFQSDSHARFVQSQQEEIPEKEMLLYWFFEHVLTIELNVIIIDIVFVVDIITSIHF